VSASFPILSAAQASEFARLGLANIRREYPHYLQHMLNGPADARTPRELHPAFYGSYDWHSCVHQHWMLVRLSLMFPHLPERAEISRVLHEHLTAENMLAEAAYFQAPGREFFERPYGWAWLLKLAQEIRAYDAELELNMAPLVSYIRTGFMRYLRALTTPVRNGIHGNTAVAVALVLGPPRAHDGPALKLFCTARAAHWVGHDTHYPRAAHCVGTSAQQGWAWRGLAGVPDAAGRRRPLAIEAGAAHYAAALPLLDAQDFNRSHWLPSFAVYTMTE